jgi:hypothetical protein
MKYECDARKNWKKQRRLQKHKAFRHAGQCWLPERHMDKEITTFRAEGDPKYVKYEPQVGGLDGAPSGGGTTPCISATSASLSSSMRGSAFVPFNARTPSNIPKSNVAGPTPPFPVAMF